MTGPIDPLIADIADRFLWTVQNPDSPSNALDARTTIADGPLTQGLGSVYHDKSDNARAFFSAMTDGMADTGVILRQVYDEYKNIDQSSAENINRRFAPPPGASGGNPPPEGGR